MSGHCWGGRGNELRGHSSVLLVADRSAVRSGIWSEGILDCDLLCSEWSCTVSWSVDSDMNESSGIEIPTADALGGSSSSSITILFGLCSSLLRGSMVSDGAGVLSAEERSGDDDPDWTHVDAVGGSVRERRCRRQLERCWPVLPSTS